MVRSLKSYLLFHILQKHSLDVLELISSSSQLTLLYTPVHKHHSSLISTTSTVSKIFLDLWLNLIVYNKWHHPKRTWPSKLSPTLILVYHWPFSQHTHKCNTWLYPKSIDRQTDRHGKTHDSRLQRCRQYSLQSYLKERLANIFRMGVGVWGCCYDGGWEVGGLNCGRVFQSYKKEDCMEVIKTKVVFFFFWLLFCIQLSYS